MIKKTLLGIAALAILTSCGSKKSAETVQEENKITVKVQKLEKRSVARTLDYAANLQADEQVFYAPATAGRIQKIYVEVGDRVKKGQLLVEMDKTQLRQTEAQFENIKTEYDRAVKLKKTNSISQQAYDQAVTQYTVTKANLEFLRENTRMEAPFDGVVTGKYFEDGEMYTGGAFGGASKPSIIALEKINPLKAYVNLSEQYFLQVKEGTEVALKCAIFPDRVFPGKVKIVYPTVDPASRTFSVEVQVPNAKEELRPGMYTNLEFHVSQSDAVLAPAIAVLKLQGSNDRYAFINNNGRAKRVNVTIGKRFEDMVEIISPDVHEGDELVVVGQGKLVDGSPLEILR
ncbi:MAG: efflux RND transporter periplasmic adaptor subunit [Bacteroides sp.]|nr:efflux RND transporter periplasmic adaptor subunit [Bacteroides sp.]MCM1085926.1 efflux RND transporter periplasmic adaptor subunit [Bacteroides sp.]